MDFGVGALAQVAEPLPEVLGALWGRVQLQAFGFIAGLFPDLLQLVPVRCTGFGIGKGLRYFCFRPVVESLDGFPKKRASLLA